MLFPRFVVFRRAPHQPGRQRVPVQRRAGLPRRHLLHQVEQRAPVPVRHVPECRARVGFQRQGAADLGLRAHQQILEVRVAKAVQHQNLRPGQQRRIQFERGIFRGGTDQQDRTVFHMRQEPVLLRLVEPVDFVDEQQRAHTGTAALARGFEHLLEVRDSGEDRRDLDEFQIGLVRQKPRDGGLAHPRRPPEDQRRQGARRQHDPKRRLRPQHLLLADDLGQRSGSQPVCQRARRLRRLIEKVGHQSRRRRLSWRPPLSSPISSRRSAVASAWSSPALSVTV